jgi:hypothetical protein
MAPLATGAATSQEAPFVVLNCTAAWHPYTVRTKGRNHSGHAYMWTPSSAKTLAAHSNATASNAMSCGQPARCALRHQPTSPHSARRHANPVLQHCDHAATLRPRCNTATTLQHCDHVAALRPRCSTATTLQHCDHAARLRPCSSPWPRATATIAQTRLC